MASLFSQSSRMGRLDTVLGTDQLVLRRFEGADHQNALFDYSVQCLAAMSDVDFDALIGTHATVTLVSHEGTETPFDGIITEARWLGAGDNGHKYALRLQPWPFLATLRRNQRIFHNMTVAAILEELLSAYADTGALVLDLSQEYPELEYTVQYRESDFAFACRLMERHGISYHFDHRPGEHDMVLTDMAQSHPSIGTRPFKPAEGHHQEDVEHFRSWQPARRITTGAIRLTDYNFKTPKAAMEVDHTGDAAFPNGQIESFDWPGDHLDQARGQVIAQLRADGERGQDRRYEAEGDIIALRAGCLVTLGGDAVPGRGDEYLCLSAYHTYESDSYGSGGAEEDETAYKGRYILMPSNAPMLPEHKTPRADVKGPQTAVVVGEGEIDCDEYGRILVQFHWDLNASISMCCRVSQNWAGNGWGGMVIPRIGMEVLVEFLDGDPDKPMVTGCVYNGRNKVPYTLPEHKTRSTFKTDTHEGNGFNELRFEDKNGKEEIYVHAEKDLNKSIENDQTTFVGGSEFRVVDQFDHTVVQVSKSTLTGVSETKNVGRSYYVQVGGGIGAASLYSLASRKSRELFNELKKLLSMRVATLAPGYYKDVDGDNIVTVSGNSSEGIGGVKTISSGMNMSLSSGDRIGVNAASDMNLLAEKTHLIAAGEEIILRCGKSEMKMTKAGQITLNGTRIDLN